MADESASPGNLTQVLNYVVQLENGQLLRNLENLAPSKYQEFVGGNDNQSSTPVDSRYVNVNDNVTTNNENELLTLLKSWNLEHVYEHFLGELGYLKHFLYLKFFDISIEKIDLEVLKIIKVRHIERLLCKFDLGTQIRFEFNLENWREKIGRPLDVCSSKSCGNNLLWPSREPTLSPVSPRHSTYFHYHLKLQQKPYTMWFCPGF